MPLIAYSPADVEFTFLMTRRSPLRKGSARLCDPAVGSEGRSVRRWIRDLGLPIFAGWAVMAGLAFVVSEPLVQQNPELGDRDRSTSPGFDCNGSERPDPIGLGDILFPRSGA